MKYLFALLLLAPSLALARPVDLQKISPDQGGAYSVEGSYKRESGNEDKTEVSGDFFGQLRRGDSLGVIYTENEWTRRGADKDERDLQHARYRHALIDTWDLEAFAQKERDSNQDLDFKTAYGIGPYRRLIESGVFNLGVGYAYVLESEKFVQDPDEQARRVYGTIDFGFKIGRMFRATEVLHSETKLDDTEDTRFYTKTVLQLKHLKNIGINLNLDTGLDTRPPSGKKEKDIKTSISFEVSF